MLYDPEAFGYLGKGIKIKCVCRRVGVGVCVSDRAGEASREDPNRTHNILHFYKRLELGI